MTPRRFLVLAVAALAVPVTLAACSSGPTGVPTIPPATPTPVVSEHPTAPTFTYPPDCPTAQPAAFSADDVRTVTISTEKGDIVMEIKGALSPIAAANFAALSSCEFYDGVVFHRVVKGFVIQGGDGQFGRAGNIIDGVVGTGGPPYKIEDEPVTTVYRRGTVAMARTAQPDSVGSQFFIVLDDAAAEALGDPQYNNYQIIGTVTSGMDAVDAIAAAADQEIPTNPIVMTKVTVATP